MKQSNNKIKDLYVEKTSPKKIEYECFNPKCFENEYLLKSYTKRPITFLGSNCWFCKTNKFLRVLKNE